jgi:hypothetical protein
LTEKTPENIDEEEKKGGFLSLELNYKGELKERRFLSFLLIKINEIVLGVLFLLVLLLTLIN